MQQNTSQPISGQLLLADFQNVFISQATIETAKYEAERSESYLLNQLTDMTSGAYLNPGTLAGSDGDVQPDISRASLDAHVKKVQAQQLDSLSAQQLQNLATQNQALYTGRKIKVTVLDRTHNPLEAVWYNNQTGYRTSPYKRQTVVGTIDEVLLEKNALVLRPTFFSGLLMRDLENYVVYVINPDTLLPMVEFTLL